MKFILLGTDVKAGASHAANKPTRVGLYVYMALGNFHDMAIGAGATLHT